jgi:uncharacterized protein (TIGR02145 family)
MSIYYGHKIFTRGTGMPYRETVTMVNPYYNCYDNLILYIKNGNDKRTRVSSAEISIDGVLVAGPSDFSKNVSLITVPLSGLNPESRLEVKLNSAPGSFLDLWVEGSVTVVAPVFTQIGPVIKDSDAPALPLISENGITGTWDPGTINTSIKGIFTYTFTPDAGQCAHSVTMDIEVVIPINTGTVTGTDGNVYKTVKFGDQWWMAENLRTVQYNNGDLIGTTASPTQDITGENNPKYQWTFLGHEIYVGIIGRLYTWYAVTDSRGVCPTGWHVPKDGEWKVMTDYLTNNGYGYEGSGDDIAKSMASTSEWTASTTPGTVGNDQASNNSSGFTAFPGGFRLSNGTFNNISFEAIWWSPDETTNRLIYSSSFRVITDVAGKKSGLSVRCVKD